MRRVNRIIKYGLQNFWRNGLLSFVASLMMTITLLTLSSYILMTMLIRVSTTQFQSIVDFRLDFKEAATDQQVRELQTQLANRPDVKQVNFISQQEALDNFRARRPDLAQIINEGDTKLPRGLQIKPTDPKIIPDIEAYLSSSPYAQIIESDTYKDSKDAIERLVRLTQLARTSSIAVSAMFGLISMVVILYTIVLAIFSRREELDIMRLVGASNAFVRLPFLIEGMLYGIIGTLVSTVILYFVIRQISPSINSYLEGKVDLLGIFSSNILFIVFVQLAIGIFIGVVSNVLGTRRFLKV